MKLSEMIVKYEQDELNDKQIIELFQELVDTGLAWNLQGHYGRRAYEMLGQGIIKA